MISKLTSLFSYNAALRFCRDKHLALCHLMYIKNCLVKMYYWPSFQIQFSGRAWCFCSLHQNNGGDTKATKKKWRKKNRHWNSSGSSLGRVSPRYNRINLESTSVSRHRAYSIAYTTVGFVIISFFLNNFFGFWLRCNYFLCEKTTSKRG